VFEKREINEGMRAECKHQHASEGRAGEGETGRVLSLIV